MRFLSVNADSFLIELSDLQETLSLYTQLQFISLYGVKDYIPAAKTILVVYDEIKTSFSQLSKLIASIDIDTESEKSTEHIIIPIRYDGEDLHQVAALQGLSERELIRRHYQSNWSVAFIGFAPGFAYLTSLDRPFQDVPRLKTPRKKSLRVL